VASRTYLRGDQSGRGDTRSLAVTADIARMVLRLPGHSLATHNLVSKNNGPNSRLVSMFAGNLLLLLTPLKEMKVLKFR
jgi:hypothetical protein